MCGKHMAKRKRNSTSSSTHSSSGSSESGSSKSSQSSPGSPLVGVTGPKGEQIKFKSKFFHKGKLPTGALTYGSLPPAALKEALHTIDPGRLCERNPGHRPRV